jgi:hypothetical protein
MSQSDYLRRKRVVTVLKNDSAENPVYNSRQFLDFKQYQVENSVVSDNIDDTKRESACSLDQVNRLNTETYAFDDELASLDTNRLIGLLTNDILFDAFSSTFRTPSVEIL